MKIHIDNVNVLAQTGPNVFALRLAKGLFEAGHEVVFDNGVSADVSLVFIEPSGAPLAPKIVQRLDGIWSKPGSFNEANFKIKRLYDLSDGVVFQSMFDRQFIEHNWGVHKKISATIHNGINVDKVTSFSHAELASLRNSYDLVFVSSANWHPQKRLRANTELFLHLRDIVKKKCCYIVLGSNPNYIISDVDVFYTGTVAEKTYLEIYSMADWMLHLSWRDHCPNTNIECLSQGTPIICSKDSGSAELINGYGIVVSEQQANDLKPFDYDNPPIIDISVVKSLTKPNIAHLPNVSMTNCAAQYITILEQACTSAT